MNVLVTRPAGAGQQLVRRLKASGIAAWHQPLIDFLPGRQLDKLPVLLNQLHYGDLLFALSGQAVVQAQPFLQAMQQHWPANVQAFAPGRASAQALQQASGLSVSYPQSREASEALLALPALQQIDGKRALILRGNGGRELLASTLTARGAQVSYCECYQRVARRFDDTALAQFWQQFAEQQIDCLVATSHEMLHQLVTLSAAAQQDRVFHCRIVVVSQRLAQLARHAGWQRIAIARRADNDALLCTLQWLAENPNS